MEKIVLYYLINKVVENTSTIYNKPLEQNSYLHFAQMGDALLWVEVFSLFRDKPWSVSEMSHIVSNIVSNNNLSNVFDIIIKRYKIEFLIEKFGPKRKPSFIEALLFMLYKHKKTEFFNEIINEIINTFLNSKDFKSYMHPKRRVLRIVKKSKKLTEHLTITESIDKSTTKIDLTLNGFSASAEDTNKNEALALVCLRWLENIKFSNYRSLALYGHALFMKKLLFWLREKKLFQPSKVEKIRQVVFSRENLLLVFEKIWKKHEKYLDIHVSKKDVFLSKRDKICMVKFVLFITHENNQVIFEDIFHDITEKCEEYLLI